MNADSEPDPERNIYQAPEADLEAETEAGLKYYVVSQTKFQILFLTTLGLYGLYWFYRHWRNYKLHSGRDLWPVPRAIFSVFFVHALFDRFYRDAIENESVKRWHYKIEASLYIVFIIVSNLSDRLVSLGFSVITSAVIGIGSIIVVAWILGRAQAVANLACGDPRGKANSRIGIANIAWILLGLVLWLLTIVGIGISLVPQGS